MSFLNAVYALIWLGFLYLVMGIVGLMVYGAEGTVVRFKATGNPGFLQITGEFLAESVETDCVTATVDLRKLKTGIALRDKHAKEKYLQVDLHPEARLNLETGMLTLHGVSKKVELKTKAVHPPTGSWEFEFKLSDYGIETPSFMGVTVADTVQVEAQAQCPGKTSHNM